MPSTNSRKAPPPGRRCTKCYPRCRRISRWPRACRRRPAREKALLRAIAIASVRVPSPNCANSNTPTGPFQRMVARRGDEHAHGIGRIRPDVQDHFLVQHRADRLHIRLRLGRELGGDHHIGGHGNDDAAFFRLFQQPLADVEHRRLIQGLAHIEAERREEGIGDAAAHDELIDLAQQGLQHRKLGRHLGSGHDGEQRPRGFLECRLERRQLAHQQRARAGHRRELRDAVSAGLGPMRRTERIHDIDVAQRRHFLRQVVRVLLFALVEAHILEEHDLARLNLDSAQPILLERDRHSQQLRQTLCHGSERELLRELAFFGPSEVRHDEHAGSGRQRRLNRRQRRADSRIAAHHAVLYRNIQIFTDQDALALEIQAQHFNDFQWRLAARVRPLSTRPRWCRACGWRTPTRCRTRNTP